MIDVGQRLGTYLVKSNILTEAQFNDALLVQKITNVPLSKVLTSLGYTSSETLIPRLAEQAGIRFVDLGSYKVDPGAIAALPEKLSRKYNALPIELEGDRLVVAMVVPDDVLAIDDIQMATGKEIEAVLATSSDIAEAIERYHNMAETLTEDFFDEPQHGGEDGEIDMAVEEAPIVKLVNMIIIKAVEQRASDIHIEPQEKDLRVRYRVDGVLLESSRSPKKLQSAILSRLKIMATLDIAETRKPQDGRCTMVVKGRNVDFRVATLPTVYGERVVLRILEKDSIMLRLEDLGFLPDTLGRFRQSFGKPYGCILVTGPTGSGKSTTLYAVLNVLNSVGKNIITTEDPVEYRLPGINQVQINSKAGLTFARGLRAILRASPDIVMVGEIRDKETAQIAVESALTGHLVLSTLHTNDAPGALSRLTEMGIAPFLTASAVDCVEAQRLARKLCSECKQPYVPEPKALRDAGFPFDEKDVPTLYKAVGCKKCNNTGFKGRVGLYEVMRMSETLERLTVERAGADEIKNVAMEEGMLTLKQDGFEKVRMGLTSIEEVLRVVV